MQLEYLAYTSVIFVSYIIVLSIGFIMGKYLLINNEASNSGFRKSTKQQNLVPNNISIDDTKVVLDIQTNNLEKKFTNIAKTLEKDNDIQSSVNKLKNMKGK